MEVEELSKRKKLMVDLDGVQYAKYWRLNFIKMYCQTHIISSNVPLKHTEKAIFKYPWVSSINLHF